VLQKHDYVNLLQTILSLLKKKRFVTLLRKLSLFHFLQIRYSWFLF